MQSTAIGYLFLLLFSYFISISTSCSNGNCQVYDSCSQDTDCGPGLYCGNCPALGKTQPYCVRGQATIPTSVTERANVGHVRRQRKRGLPINGSTYWKMGDPGVKPGSCRNRKESRPLNSKSASFFL